MVHELEMRMLPFCCLLPVKAATPLLRRGGGLGTMLKLSEAVELGMCLERGGSPFSFKACAIGLAMAAISVPVHERTAKKAEELWPWLRQETRRSFFGLMKVDHMSEIGDWYFNVKL